MSVFSEIARTEEFQNDWLVGLNARVKALEMGRKNVTASAQARRVQVVTGGAGTATASIIGDTSGIILSLVGDGVSFFAGARGIAQNCAVPGGSPIWVAGRGEWDGFSASLSGAGPTYGWTEIGASGTPLSSAALGNATDAMAAGYDAAYVGRKAFPAGTVVRLHWDGSKMFFMGGADPTTCNGPACA